MSVYHYSLNTENIEIIEMKYIGIHSILLITLKLLCFKLVLKFNCHGNKCPTISSKLDSLVIGTMNNILSDKRDIFDITTSLGNSIANV